MYNDMCHLSTIGVCSASRIMGPAQTQTCSAHIDPVLLRATVRCHVPSLVHSSSPSLMGSAVPTALYHAIIASHPPPPLRLLAFTMAIGVAEVHPSVPLYLLAMTSFLVMSAPYCSCSSCSRERIRQAWAGGHHDSPLRRAHNRSGHTVPYEEGPGGSPNCMGK